MKLIIERASLLVAMSHVQNAVEKRNTIPILSNVLLTAEDGFLCLTATDLDLSIVEKIKGEIIDEGSTTTPAHLLYEIIRKLPEGSQVEIESAEKNSKIIIKTGRSRFSLPCLPREDYPVIDNDKLPVNFNINSKDFKKLIDKTKFAMSHEETRYYLNGIYLHSFKENSQTYLRAVATDGHRLALSQTILPSGAEKMSNIIIPRKAISELHRLIDQKDIDIEINISESQVQFNISDIILSTKLIDGTFPDYQRVIPEGNDKIIEINRNQLSDAVDRVSTISTEKSRAIKLNFDSKVIKVSASSPDAGSAIEEFEVSYNGDNIEIGFNSRYLLDILYQISSEVTTFDLADSVSPAVIKDLDNDNSIYVLMPMRV